MWPVSWIEDRQPVESLAVCLRAVIEGRGVTVNLDDVVAALGLGAVVTAVPSESVDQWGAWGRDTALLAAAELYGLRLRELHPPAAACGLGASAEFPQHFVDSYLPIIRSALECGQLALAWRGWPPPSQNLWGIIAKRSDDQLMGYTLHQSSRCVPLCAAAHQVYIVEDYSPVIHRVNESVRFASALDLALRCWRNEWSADPLVRSGEVAWEELVSRCTREERVDHHADRGIAAALTQIVAARRSLARWLRGILNRLGEEDRTLAVAWAAMCESVAAALEPPVSTATAAPDPHRAAELHGSIVRAAQLERTFYARAAASVALRTPCLAGGDA